jgi:hypothetical protein
MKTRFFILALVYFGAGWPGGAARAQEPATEEIPPHLAALSDRDVEQRLQFLEERLDSSRQYAGLWWKGWTTFYSLGVVIEATRAGLTDNYDAKRADLILSSVKAAGGVANLLLRPLQAKDGADAVRRMPSASREDRLRQLARAEEQLRINAEQADKRYSLLRHGLNFAVNGAAALIVWQGFDDPSRAGRSFGIGVAVGEAMIWSQPWWPAADWQEYQRRFDTRPRVSWQLVPTLGGAALQVKF